jgi:hypothetical protein
MKANKPTKKAASPLKRKTAANKSQNVAEFRQMIKDTIGGLIAIDQMIDRLLEDRR